MMQVACLAKYWTSCLLAQKKIDINLLSFIAKFTFLPLLEHHDNMMTLINGLK